jgi:ankyrin repeat protein
MITAQRACSVTLTIGLILCSFVAGVHTFGDCYGCLAAQNIKALLSHVFHPAYRLELLTSRATGQFFCPVNGSVKIGQTPLHFAVSLGKWEAVIALLEDACCLLHDLHTETRENLKPEKYLRNFHCEGIDDQVIAFAYKEQLKRQYSILWAKDSQGNTVFHLAVIHSQKLMYRKLYDFSERLSKLLHDIYFGQMVSNEKQIVGSKFNSFKSYHDDFLKNESGYTPLELAAYLGNIDMMRYMLQNFETEVKWGFADGSVALNKVRGNSLFCLFDLL